MSRKLAIIAVCLIVLLAIGCTGAPCKPVDDPLSIHYGCCYDRIDGRYCCQLDTGWNCW